MAPGSVENDQVFVWFFRGAILVHEEPTGGFESLDTSKKQEALTTNEV